jgi:cyclopropane fatty-acyl-phospholipid synthase-like methyltransferase
MQARRAEIAAMVDRGAFGNRFFGDPTTGEEFLRGWEFYLQACEAGFWHQGMCVFQVQLAKHLATVPISRDYMYREGARV